MGVPKRAGMGMSTAPKKMPMKDDETMSEELLWEVNELDCFFAVQSRVSCSCCGKKKTTAMIGKGVSNAKVVAYRKAREANGQKRRPDQVVDTRPTGLGCDHIGDKFSGRGRRLYQQEGMRNDD